MEPRSPSPQPEKSVDQEPAYEPRVLDITDGPVGRKVLNYTVYELEGGLSYALFAPIGKYNYFLGLEERQGAYYFSFKTTEFSFARVDSTHDQKVTLVRAIADFFETIYQEKKIDFFVFDDIADFTDAVVNGEYIEHEGDEPKYSPHHSMRARKIFFQMYYTKYLTKWKYEYDQVGCWWIFRRKEN